MAVVVAFTGAVAAQGCVGWCSLRECGRACWMRRSRSGSSSRWAGEGAAVAGSIPLLRWVESRVGSAPSVVMIWVASWRNSRPVPDPDLRAGIAASERGTDVQAANTVADAGGSSADYDRLPSPMNRWCPFTCDGALVHHVALPSNGRRR